MKVLIYTLAFTATVRCGLLPHLETAQLSLPENSIHQVPETKIVKVIHEIVPAPHATVPTPPLKVLKVIEGSSAGGVPASVAVPGPSKLVKVIHQSVAPRVLAQPKIVKVVHQSVLAPVVAPLRPKVLKVYHEYAPSHYVQAPQNTKKILKVNKQQISTPVAAPVIGQNVRVYKVFKQSSGVISSALASYGAGRHYASNYFHENGVPVKVTKFY